MTAYAARQFCPSSRLIKTLRGWPMDIKWHAGRPRTSESTTRTSHLILCLLGICAAALRSEAPPRIWDSPFMVH
eukprot:1017963-Pleurochrysis_carterae.AAC.1